MTWLVPLAIVFVAGIVTGVTGFGFSVLSVPVLLLALPPRQVVVIALLLVPLTSAVLLLAPGMRDQIHLRTLLVLTALSVIGLPIGLAIFERLDPLWVTCLMGLVLVAYAVCTLRRVRPLRLNDQWVAPSGLLGGILATSTGLSGPAVAMYVHGRSFPPRQQVATMAAYVGAISIFGLALLFVRGAASGEDLQRAVILSSGAVPGVLVGRWWARRQHELLDRWTVVALGLMGAWTVARSVVTCLVKGVPG